MPDNSTVRPADMAYFAAMLWSTRNHIVYSPLLHEPVFYALVTRVCVLHSVVSLHPARTAQSIYL